MENKTVDINMGTLYDVNKQASAAEKLLSPFEINKKMDEIDEFVKNSDDIYFMLLNKETSNYTLFNFSLKDKNRKNSFKKDIRECLLNRGKIVSISVKGTEAVEIWLRTQEEDVLYYFFPYGLGVIEIE